MMKNEMARLKDLKDRKLKQGHENDQRKWSQFELRVIWHRVPKHVQNMRETAEGCPSFFARIIPDASVTLQAI